MGLLAEGESLYDAGNIVLMHHVYAALRAHAHHRAIFNTIMIAVTAMTLSRVLLHLAGASLAALIVADLLLTAAAMAVGAVVIARWMITATIVGVALAALVAARPEHAPDHMLVVYSILNLTILAGWAITSRPRPSPRSPTATRSG